VVQRSPIAALLDKFAFGLLWGFVLDIPMEGNTMVAGFVITRWLGMLALGVALFRCAMTRTMRKPCLLHAWMAAFVVWVALSLAWTIDTEMTISRLGSYVQLLIMVWLIWELATTEKRWASLLFAFCIGAGLSSINAIKMLHTGMTDGSEEAQKLAEYGRFAPTGFDQNEFALVLALSVPMAIYLLTREKSFWKSAVCWVELGLAGFGILLSGSRAGLLCLVVTSVMVPLAMPRFSPGKRRLLWVVLPCVAVCAASYVPAGTWERLMTTGSELSAGTLDHRTVIWAAGVSVFRQHPLIGIGSGAFATAVGGIIDIFYVAHNSFLSILVELGVIGEMILLGLMASMFYLASRMRGLDRWLWVILLLTWSVGVSSLTWEYRKATWFLFAMVAAEAGFATTVRPKTVQGQVRRFL